MISDADLCDIAALSYEEHTGRENEVEYLMMYGGGYQIVAFRGTEASKLVSGNGVWDVLRDIRAYPWYDERTGWMHSGFLKGGRVVADRRLKHGDKSVPVILTGHSMGAATSLAAALILHAEGFSVKWVGFGSPRMFTSPRELPFPFMNYRHADDPVTYVPKLWCRHAPKYTQIGDPDGIEWWPEHKIGVYQEAMRSAENEL